MPPGKVQEYVVAASMKHVDDSDGVTLIVVQTAEGMPLSETEGLPFTVTTSVTSGDVHAPAGAVV